MKAIPENLKTEAAKASKTCAHYDGLHLHEYHAHDAGRIELCPEVARFIAERMES